MLPGQVVFQIVAVVRPIGAVWHCAGEAGRNAARVAQVPVHCLLALVQASALGALEPLASINLNASCNYKKTRKKSANKNQKKKPSRKTILGQKDFGNFKKERRDRSPFGGADGPRLGLERAGKSAKDGGFLRRRQRGSTRPGKSREKCEGLWLFLAALMGLDSAWKEPGKVRRMAFFLAALMGIYWA